MKRGVFAIWAGWEAPPLKAVSARYFLCESDITVISGERSPAFWIKTPSRRHFRVKTDLKKTGSTSKIGSRNGFVRFGNFYIFRSLSPHGVLNSGHKLTVTYYGEITIEPILNPEFDVDHDFEVKNGCFQSLFPRFRVISACSTGRASHSDHFSGQVSMATILQDFNLFRRGFQLRMRDHLPDEG